jgi:hypothetical protein
MKWKFINCSLAIIYPHRCLYYSLLFNVCDFKLEFFLFESKERGMRGSYVGLFYCFNTLCGGLSKPQSTYRGRGEIGGVYGPSQLERTVQLCT